MSIEALEQWVQGHKGRYVRDLGIDTGYGATCWSLILGNVGVKPQKGWHLERGQACVDRAEVFASETNFFGTSDDSPPNVVVVVDGNSMEDWPGLAKVIEVAIERANALNF